MIANSSDNGRKPLTCPVCGSKFYPDAAPTMPFCSERCQKVDLGRWLDEGYGLPIEGSEEQENLPDSGDDEDLG